MNWRVNTNPKKDGDYLLAMFIDNHGNPFSVSTVGFTTDGGWNTYRSFFGDEVDTRNSFGFEPSYSWAWIPIEETGVREAKERALEANRG